MEKDLINPIKNFRELFEELSAKIKTISNDKEKNEKLQKIIEEHSPLVAELQSPRDNLADYFKFFHFLRKISMNIREIIEFLENNFSRAKLDSYITQTSYANFHEIEEKLVSAATKFQKSREAIEPNLYRTILEKSGKSSVAELQSNFREYPESVDFYVFILQKLADEGNVSEISEVIEQDKDWALGAEEVKSASDVPFMFGFGIIPVTRAMTLSELCEELKIPRVDSVDALKKHYEGFGVETVIIRTMTQSPIIYKSINLIGKRVDLKQGLNPSSVKFLETISQGPKSKWDFTIESGNLPSAEKATYIQQVSDIHFKVLMRKPEQPGPIKKVKMQRTDRRDKYNALIIDKAKNKMFTSIKHSTENLEKKSEIVDPKYLVNDIYIDIIEDFEKKKRAKKSPKELFTSPDYTKIYVARLKREFHDYFRKNLYLINIDKININEVFVSFEYHLRLYARNFSKDLYDSFVKKNDLIFSDERDLKNIFEELIMELLKRYISVDNNIYKDMYTKILVRKLTIT